MIAYRRTGADLIKTANEHARARQAPANTIIKELLHYEIIQALILSGASKHLVFHGGTCLRLCHRGNRYSEDLDFAGGADFTPKLLEPFQETLRQQIASAYGLEVEVTTKNGAPDSDGVAVSRWQARIAVPNPNPSVQQRQIINVEVATIPAHKPTILPVAANYETLTPAQRGLVLRAETAHEILADKMKAIVTRPFLKYRDVWDIKFLLDRGESLDPELVLKKLGDYGWTRDRYVEASGRVLEALETEQARRGYDAEMSRFVDAPVAEMFRTPGIIAASLSQVRNAVVRCVAMVQSLEETGPTPATAPSLG